MNTIHAQLSPKIEQQQKQTKQNIIDIIDNTTNKINNIHEIYNKQLETLETKRTQEIEIARTHVINLYDKYIGIACQIIKDKHLCDINYNKINNLDIDKHGIYVYAINQLNLKITMIVKWDEILEWEENNANTKTTS